MSFEPKPEESPIAHFEQPKSGKKWWLIGGLGCGFLLLLCCGGGGLAAFMIGKPFQDIMRESQEYARTSEVVADALGEPIAVAEQPNEITPKQTIEDGVSYMEYRYAVEGSQGSGDLIVKIAVKGGFKFERESLALEMEDGTIIDLNPEEEFSVDIDMGDDLGEEEE